MKSVGAARHVIHHAIDQRIFPAAVAEVGSADGALWREAFGTLMFDAAAPVDETTPFDLASLTKVIAATTVMMQLVTNGRLELQTAVADRLADWRGADRLAVTIADVLEHASGLAARLVDPPGSSRREFEHDICTMALEYPPRTASVYSDLGFILLGFIAADAGGASLDRQFAAIWDELRAALHVGEENGLLAFEVEASRRGRAAPTLPMDEDLRRGRLLVGEVHDNYAAALGGVAGHAGLFGSAPAVGAFARAVLRARNGDTRLPSPFAPSTVGRFVRKTTVPGSSRALGWDTMLTTSSCGTTMTTSAFGHVGFTGTSLWIDPDRDRYYVLLTNRACGGGSLDEMRRVRRDFHDAAHAI